MSQIQNLPAFLNTIPLVTIRLDEQDSIMRKGNIRYHQDGHSGSTFFYYSITDGWLAYHDLQYYYIYHSSPHAHSSKKRFMGFKIIVLRVFLHTHTHTVRNLVVVVVADAAAADFLGSSLCFSYNNYLCCMVTALAVGFRLHGCFVKMLSCRDGVSFGSSHGCRTRSCAP
jgi:hypothetical protein